MNASLSTRKKILERLIQARSIGEPVSGSTLASELGISRNAVWKSIHALQEEGYEIRSIQSKGYCLETGADILSQDEIQGFLCRKDVSTEELKLTVLDSIDSTNNYCKTLPYGDPATAVIANYQSSGRGRYGRSFLSPKGTGIYLTYSFQPLFPIQEISQVTTVAAVLTHQVLSRISGETLGIKWVNDIYRGNLKICGILTEALGSLDSGNFERVIVGIGINCLKGGFPPELSGIAGSLSDSAQPAFTRNQIASELILELHRALDGAPSLNASQYLDYYREHCFIIGKQVTVTETGKEPVSAYVEGVDDQYHLLVNTPDGRRSLSGGEVSLKL